jgi:hypothetical protein
MSNRAWIKVAKTAAVVSEIRHREWLPTPVYTYGLSCYTAMPDSTAFFWSLLVYSEAVLCPAVGILWCLIATLWPTEWQLCILLCGPALAQAISSVVATAPAAVGSDMPTP